MLANSIIASHNKIALNPATLQTDSTDPNYYANSFRAVSSQLAFNLTEDKLQLQLFEIKLGEYFEIDIKTESPGTIYFARGNKHMVESRIAVVNNYLFFHTKYPDTDYRVFFNTNVISNPLSFNTLRLKKVGAKTLELFVNGVSKGTASSILEGEFLVGDLVCLTGSIFKVRRISFNGKIEYNFNETGNDPVCYAEPYRQKL